MELKEFISGTIISICDAIKDVQEKYRGTDVVINPEKIHTYSDGAKTLDASGRRFIQEIEFDVMVMAEDSGTTAGSAGLKVWGLGAGVKQGNSITNQSSSRIKFTLPIAFPTAETPGKYEPVHFVV